MKPKLSHVIATGILFAATLFVYWPGLGGPFLYDDYRHIIQNDNIRFFSLTWKNIGAVTEGIPGEIFSRPLAKITFALDYYFAGNQFSPFQFKRTNLIIHIINGFLILALTINLYGIKKNKRDGYWLPILVTGIWLLHPIHLTTTLYVVQRMTSLMTIFVLGGLTLYSWGRIQLAKESGNQTLAKMLMFIGAIFGISLGILFKENAILLPAYALVLELTLFTQLDTERSQKNFICLFFSIFLLLPILGAAWYIIQNPGIIFDPFTFRDFNRSERILTQFRVIIYYIYLLIFPGNGEYSLYHDDFIISRSLLNPITTLPAIILVSGITFLSLKYRKKYPIIAFGILWFLIGHSMESTILNLEIAWEHRNYLPSVGLIFSLTYAACNILYSSERIPPIGKYKFAFPIFIIFLLFLVTRSLASIWGNPESYSQYNLKIHPNSCNANNMRAHRLRMINGDAKEIYSHYLKCATLENREVSGLINMRKITEQLLYLARENQIETIIPDSFSSPNWYSELHLNTIYLTSLNEALDREIESRLAQFPVGHESAANLVIAENCATSHPDCMNLLPSVKSWITIALENKVPRASKALLHHSMAKLYAHEGSAEKAIQEMNLAVELVSEQKMMKIHQVLLYLSLNDPGQAQKIFDSLKEESQISPDLKSLVKEKIHESFETGPSTNTLRPVSP